MSRRRPLIAPLCAAVALSLVPSQAGGPRAVNGLGQPLAWNAASPIVYDPDAGPLGTFDNAEARQLVAAAFGVWAGTGLVSFTEGALLPADVNGVGVPATNAAHFLHFWRDDGDGLTPVIFDDDGSVIDGLFGNGARFDILGAAALDTRLGRCAGGPNDGDECLNDGGCPSGACSPQTEIMEASIVINGLFHDAVGLPSSPPDLAPQAFAAVVVHEIGHLLNLDHSVVNHDLANDGNPANDIYLPTMYPVLADDEAALASLNLDDVAALRSLYDPGAPAAAISGVVRTAAGVPFQGANVVVRSPANPRMTAYSAISGARFFPCHPGSLCDPCSTACDPGNPTAQGTYSAELLAPGNYKICVEQIDTRFSFANGSFVGPLATPPLLPGPEECYDLAESGAVTDDPDNNHGLSAGILAIDLTLNALAGPGDETTEPNDGFGTARSLGDLANGQDSEAGYIAAGDRDVFVLPGPDHQFRHVRIDIDAAELGSSLDAVIALVDSTGTIYAVADDAIDPDSGAFTLDPALDVTVMFSGMAYIFVSSYPDLNLDGVGGSTTGGYWIRVRGGHDAGQGVARTRRRRCRRVRASCARRRGAVDRVAAGGGLAAPAPELRLASSGPAHRSRGGARARARAGPERKHCRRSALRSAHCSGRR